jgi:peroxiredoxin
LPSAIEQVHREFSGRGLAVVAIDIREPADTVAAWVEKHKTTFTVLLDTDGEVTQQYEVTVTPTVFLVRNGRLIGKAVGTKPWTSESGRALLGALLRS